MAGRGGETPATWLATCAGDGKRGGAWRMPSKRVKRRSYPKEMELDLHLELRTLTDKETL